MFGKKIILGSLISIVIVTLSSPVYSGCSRKTEQDEKPAIAKNISNTRKIPVVTQQELRYSNETGKITTVEARLNADKTPEAAQEAEEQIKKPSIFIEEYLQDHPQTPEGAKALRQIAKAYGTIDSVIGNQQERIAKARNLIVSLYPDSPEAAEAQEWLDSQK